MVIVYRNASTCFVYKDQWDPGCTTTRHNISPSKINGKKQSSSLDRGWGDPGLNPSKGSLCF